MPLGARPPTKFESLWGKLRFSLRDKLASTVTVEDDRDRFRLRVGSPVEQMRAWSFFSKEQGTIEWIRAEVRPGDVFYDIGANVGLYTLMAARCAGPQGQVYAFEPHVGNVATLLENVSLNGFAANVKVVSSALHESDGFLDFNYNSLIPGTAMSQLGATVDADEREFRPAASEYKCCHALDTLVEAGFLLAPQHIKIDVDGNELPILRGMKRLLAGPSRPKSLQVEVNQRYKAELQDFMRSVGYEFSRRHDTYYGQQQIDAGVDAELIPHNAIFHPVAGAAAPLVHSGDQEAR